jgi:phosphoribosyl 1,2-cyclic phosphodiesterase
VYESPSKSGIEIRALASGSSGNSILISSKGTNVLIDAGLTCKELTRRLGLAGSRVEDVSAVIITHEHIDHIRGAGVLSRRHGTPVFMNAATLEGASRSIGAVPSVRTFTTGDTLKLGDLTVQTYPLSHDAAEPIGLTIRNGSGRIGVALDMGYPTKLARERLRGSNALILEFNHDPEMLRQSDRPWEVKQRILSKRGHMSNEDALEFLCELVHDELRAVVLAHISREANCRETLRSLVSERLNKIGRADIQIILGDQDEVADPIRI